MRATMNVPRKRRQPPRVNTIAGVKWCPKCESRLAVHLFGAAADRADGLSGWCRGCRAKSEQGRRAADPQAYRTATKKRYRLNPEHWHAKVAVARAVARGLLSKPTTCPKCELARKIEAHHTRGYERRFWLTVEWMCRQCHTLTHKRGESRAASQAA